MNTPINGMSKNRRKWIVDTLKESTLYSIDNSKSDRITLTKAIAGPSKSKKFIQLDLMLVDNMLWIEPLTYEFRPRNCHFEYRQTEQRWTRNQVQIINMVNLFRRKDLWKYVSNKNFFEVNERNPHIKGKLAEQVEERLHDALHGKIVKAQNPKEDKE